MKCKVVRWFPDRGFGFVKLEDGREAYLGVGALPSRGMGRWDGLKGSVLEISSVEKTDKGLRAYGARLSASDQERYDEDANRQWEADRVKAKKELAETWEGLRQAAAPLGEGLRGHRDVFLAEAEKAIALANASGPERRQLVVEHQLGPDMAHLLEPLDFRITESSGGLVFGIWYVKVGIQNPHGTTILYEVKAHYTDGVSVVDHREELRVRFRRQVLGEASNARISYFGQGAHRIGDLRLEEDGAIYFRNESEKLEDELEAEVRSVLLGREEVRRMLENLKKIRARSEEDL